MNNIKKSAENLQKYGRNGDTLLAHITPAEANLLKAFGGSGTINPTTGLPEYFFSFIGDFLNNTLGSFNDVVTSKIEAIEEDPIKFAAQVAAVASGHPELLPVIEGIDTLEEGGTIGESLLAGGKAYAGQQIGAELGAEFGGSEFGTGEDFNMGDFSTGEDFNMGGFLPTGEDFDMGVSLGDADIQPGGFYGGGTAPEVQVFPGELGDIIEVDGKILTSSGSDILPAPSSFNISPMQALQGLRGASGLLGRGQQQQQAVPQMQMGSRTQMPQGAVDYSGIYNLLALQRARNPNSLLG
jgi:hypothetical protein